MAYSRRRFLSMALTGAAVLGAVGGCGPSRSGKGEGIRIGMLPFLDYAPWSATEALGIADELDLPLELVNFSLEPGVVSAMAKGSVDLANAALAAVVPLLPKTPDIRLIGTTSQFRGFAFITRTAEGYRTYQELVGTATPAAARRRAVQQFKGKKIVTLPSSFQATIDGTLAAGGLTARDVEILGFNQSATAAIAFIRGEGDVFLGGLPETVRLLDGEDRGKFQAVIQNQQIGRAGLWYSNLAAPRRLVDERRHLLLKLIAAWYRTARYVRERPDRALRPVVDFLNEQTGGGLDIAGAKKQIPRFVFIHTLDEAKKTVYNPAASTYWA